MFEYKKPMDEEWWRERHHQAKWSDKPLKSCFKVTAIFYHYRDAEKFAESFERAELDYQLVLGYPMIVVIGHGKRYKFNGDEQ